MFSNLKALTIPEGNVVKISAGGVTLWEKPQEMKNWARYSTEADGVTIYNNGLGYKDGYRIRSGGAEAALSVGVLASCTGFIPLKAGDVVRLSGYDALHAGVENAINVSNSNRENIGQISSNTEYGYGVLAEAAYKDYRWNSIVENPTGVYTWVCPPHPDIAFMRVSGHANGENMIITVNQEIPV